MRNLFESLNACVDDGHALSLDVVVKAQKKNDEARRAASRGGVGGNAAAQGKWLY
jgi:hypothetical protein